MKSWMLPQGPGVACGAMVTGFCCAFVLIAGGSAAAAATSAGPAASGWKVQLMPGDHFTNSFSNGVSCSAQACISAGYYTDLSDEQTALAEEWTGQAWSRQRTPRAELHSSILNGISCTSTNACMAVGTVTQTWNGTAWTLRPAPGLSGPFPGSLAGVSCTAADACTAVGNYFPSGGPQVPLAERWNGKAWRIQATPLPPGAGGYLTAVSCTAATSCVAVGSYVGSSGRYLTLAESWNGKKWSMERTPNPVSPKDIFLNGVSCTSASACVAVGDGRNVVSRSGTARGFGLLSEVWNGRVWTIKRVPVPANATIAYLLAVSCGAVSSCTAVGSSVESPTQMQTLAVVWNGQAWQLQATANPSGTSMSELDGVSCLGVGRCAALGWYEAPIGQETVAEGEGGL